MSWFSLSVQGKEVIDQHSSISGYFTGNFISNYVYDTVKNNPFNLLVRNTATNKLVDMASPQLESASKKISKKVLKKTFNEEKLIYSVTKLKDKFLTDPTRYTINMTKFAYFIAKETVKKVAKGSETAGSSNTLNPITMKLAWDIFKAPLKGKFSEQVQDTIVQILTPMCEEVVQKALVATTKAAGEKAYDFTAKKASSIIVLPAIYSSAFMALEVLGNYYQTPILGYLKYLPSVSTILGTSVVLHAAQIAGVVWEETTKAPETNDQDKEEVKEIALNFAKEKMTQKIKDNELLTYLGFNKTQGDIDKLLKTMVSEAVDFYWQDMHKTKVLGLPLVA